MLLFEITHISKENAEISKFLCYVLRHQPESVGLSLDKKGWAVISDLIICCVKEGYPLDKGLLLQIVDTSDKKRFTVSDNGLRIRAAQGHSTQQVDIAYQQKTPPDILYHGTAVRFLSAIQQQGLLPRSRQYVHLSTNEATASQVGQRHGKPIVLKINARHMYEQGFSFYQSENGVWLTESVPCHFIND